MIKVKVVIDTARTHDETYADKRRDLDLKLYACQRDLAEWERDCRPAAGSGREDGG